MTAIVARIIARYVAGALVAYGLIPHELGQEFAVDPDVALAIGGILTVVTEVAYAFARKKGWAT